MNSPLELFLGWVAMAQLAILISWYIYIVFKERDQWTLCNYLLNFQKLTTMQVLLNIFLFAVLAFLFLAGSQTAQDLWRDWRRDNPGRFLSVIFLTIIAALGSPAQAQEQAQDFELKTPIYIELSGKDSIFRDSATVAIRDGRFYIRRGCCDTLSRKIYKTIGSRHYLSCGDHLKVDRHAITGKARNVHYLERSNYWFYSKYIKTTEN